jgi:hypothetical protein
MDNGIEFCHKMGKKCYSMFLYLATPPPSLDKISFRKICIFCPPSVKQPGLENCEYGRGGPLRWPRDTLYPQKLALT